MNVRKDWLMALLLLGVVLASVPALAQEDFAFREQFIKNVSPGSCDFVRLASVPFTAPEDGFVVVTASGVAFFNNSRSFLELTLDTRPARRGAWIFDLTPGWNLSQTYSPRMVFPVEAGVANTFFLNGRSCKGPGGRISVQTGSITAEFHPTTTAQVQPSGLGPEGATSEEQGRTRIRH
jgi:hypothetical protein